MGQQVQRDDGGGTACGKDMVGLALCVHGDPFAQAGVTQVDLRSLGLEGQRAGGLAHDQMQAAIMSVRQVRAGTLAAEFEFKSTHSLTMRAPAIAGAERVAARAGAFVQERARHSGCSGQRQGHRLLVKQGRGLARNQRGIELRLCERITAHHMPQELHVGGQAHDVRLRQRRVEAGECLLARGAVHDQLGDHRVVKRRDRIALAHTVVDPHRRAREAAARRLAIDLQDARGREKFLIGVFGADAGFDGVAVDAQLVLGQGQRLA